MKNYKEFTEITSGMTGCFAAALTDEYLIGRWPEDKKLIEGKEEKILEVRVFNEKKEAKIFRSDIGRPFSDVRVMDDDNLPEGIDSFSQEQFLDIDTERSEGASEMIHTTGGGRYNLPINNINDAKVKIKYYMSSDPESGMARIIDWRIVGFVEANNG